MTNYTYLCNEMTPMYYYSPRTCENLSRRPQKIAAPIPGGPKFEGLNVGLSIFH
jgi:hypothetical protein